VPVQESTSHPPCRATRRRISGGGAVRGCIRVAIVFLLALWTVAWAAAGAQEPTSSSPEEVRAQPAGGRRPRIAVEKRNDASGDGRFSRDEVAARPGTDVTFMVNITNVGRVSFRIRRISDSYGTTNIEVCRELFGRTLRPGRAVACTFTVEDYTPSRFDSRANTVGVSAKDTKGDRTAAAAAISTVTTLDSAAEVRGRTARGDGRDDEDLARTGPYTSPLWALALSLLATGSELLALARRRGRKHAPRRTG
jgi:hypothetical protein